MIESISQERWEQALSGELNHYDYGNQENYRRSSLIILNDYFKINVEKDLIGKKILESGGGSYPSVSICSGLKKSVNVEPNYNNFPEEIKNYLSSKNIECISIGFEDYTGRTKFDEVWFFNVLQHVRDPLLQIENAKKIAKTIRVFEPINTAVNNEHPHSFNLEFFENQFPNTKIGIHRGGSVDKFHQADCVYFVWRSGTK